MKAVLIFDLPEESEEHLVCIHAKDLYFALRNIDLVLGNMLEHGHKLKTPDDVIESIRDLIREELTDHHCNLEMMS